jgi:hypothetical protein
MSISSYRSAIDRLSRDKASLEKELARERERVAKIQGDISAVRRSMTGSVSVGSLNSKQRQLESKYKDLAQHQKKVAVLEGKISSKISEINKSTQNLERAEAQAHTKQIAEDKRRMNDELRHVKAVTREAERQTQLYSQLGSNRMVIDIARLPEIIKVLFVASNPLDQSQLRLDEEIRAIERQIRASEHRDSVQLVAKWAARPLDIIQALNEHKPHVVHFSGHGSESDELIFQADDGSTKLVPKEAIVTTISTAADNVRVVMFNACFSQGQAQAVTKHVDVAIGMNDAIGDEAARVFSAQFYSAIGFGRSVQQAFNQGKAALLLESIPGASTVELFARDGVDADSIVLVRPPK